MAAGLSMEIRKRQGEIRPRLCGENWTDDDLAPWMFGDYAIHDQHESVQAMIELAECLADARVQWALKAARERVNERGTVHQGPRHYVGDSVFRRGFSGGKD